MPWRSWAVVGVVWGSAVAVAAVTGTSFFAFTCCFGCPAPVYVDLSATEPFTGFLASFLLVLAWRRKYQSMRRLQESELS